MMPEIGFLATWLTREVFKISQQTFFFLLCFQNICLFAQFATNIH